MNEQILEELKKTMLKQYPLGIPRKNIGSATGGIIHPRTCANLDCLGKGIKGRYAIGRNTIYPVQSVIDFIQSKISYNNLTNN